MEESNTIRDLKELLEDETGFVPSRQELYFMGHWVLGGRLTFKKIDRSWDMCFLMQNDIGINVY